MGLPEWKIPVVICANVYEVLAWGQDQRGWEKTEADNDISNSRGDSSVGVLASVLSVPGPAQPFVCMISLLPTTHWVVLLLSLSVEQNQTQRG
jgi:hypothetical protein